MKLLKNHKWSLIGILFFSILFMSVLFLNPYHENDDTVFHIANIVSLADSIRMHGWFGSPILPNLANFFGYASHLLYPPLAHTFSSYVFLLFEQFGLTVTDSLKFVHFFVFFLSGIAMYEFSYKLYKRKTLAFFSSIIYLSMPYHLSEHYVRDALGELFVFPFLPMILSGVVSLLDDHKKSFYPLFVIGYLGGILSHFTIMIYFTIFLAIFLFVYHKKVFKKEFLIPFSIATVSVLGISLFFLESMVEYKIHGHIAVFLEGVMSWGVYGTSLWPWEYLPFWNMHEEVCYGFSFLSFLLILSTILFRKKLEFPKYAKGFFIMGILALFCSSKLFYFDLLPSLFYMIQFAWRLCTFFAIIVAIFAPMCLQKANKKVIAVLLILFCIIPFFEIHFRNNSTYIHSNKEVVHSGAAMGWQHEYLPENAYRNEEYYENRKYEIITKNGKAANILEDHLPNLVFEAKEGATLELPRLYYIGYELVNEEKNKIPIYENEMGFIETVIPKDGIYTLSYPGTTGKKVARVISIVSLFVSILCYFAYLLHLSKKKHT